MPRNLPAKAVGWGVAGLTAVVVVVLGLFVFNQMVSPPTTSPDKKEASKRIFSAKIPALKDSGPPNFVNRVKPKAEETTARTTAETTRQPPAAEPPPVAERPAVAERPPAAKRPSVAERPKAPPQRIIQAQVKAPPIKPVRPKKGAAKNTIYRESWLLDQDSSFYTLQVLGVRNEESLLNFIKVHKLLQNQNVAYYKTVNRSKQWYPLLYGVYPTKSEAADAVRELPDKIQKSIPWIRKIAAIQNEVQAATKR